MLKSLCCCTAMHGCSACPCMLPPDLLWTSSFVVLQMCIAFSACAAAITSLHG